MHDRRPPPPPGLPAQPPRPISRRRRPDADALAARRLVGPSTRTVGATVHDVAWRRAPGQMDVSLELHERYATHPSHHPPYPNRETRHTRPAGRHHLGAALCHRLGRFHADRGERPQRARSMHEFAQTGMRRYTSALGGHRQPIDDHRQIPTHAPTKQSDQQATVEKLYRRQHPECERASERASCQHMCGLGVGALADTDPTAHVFSQGWIGRAVS